MPARTDTNSTPADTSRFATTHWSVIQSAGSPDSSRYTESLKILCQSYWFPLYAYLRRRGYDQHQAEDHTQSFFVHLLEKPTLSRADPRRGRFRSFLLSSLKHFVADAQDRARAQKRGGNKHIFSMDFADGERRYCQEPTHDVSPEKLFERWWALSVLNRATQRLKTEFKTTARQALFDRLKDHLVAERGMDTYKDIAAEFDMTDTAVRVTAHRLRQRFHALVREEISQTVSHSTDIDEEIQDLFTALSC